jgi:protoporphyrinogen/coproporphyrinogen III oxidase
VHPGVRVLTEGGRVAVVGGGIAGLAAAWRLAEGAARVVVYEAAADVGGRIRTEVIDGVAIDASVQFLPSYYARTHALLRDAGLAGRLQRAPGRDAFWRGGRAHIMELGSAVAMARSGALPTRLKLRLLTRYLPFLTRYRGRLDAADPVSLPPELDGESAGAWGRRELGDDFVELVMTPLLATTQGATAEETAAGWFHALAAAGLDLTLTVLPDGMATFPAELAAGLAARGVEVQCGARVARVEAAGGGWVVAGAAGEARFDAVVIALPAAQVAGVVTLPAEAGAWLAQVAVRPTGTLVLYLDPAPGADYFGLTFPPAEGGGVAALCVQAGKRPHRGGGDGVVVFPHPELAALFASGDAQAAYRAVEPTLRSALPGLSRALRKVRLRVLPDGHTLFPPGSSQRLRAFGAVPLPAGLALAGDYLGAPNVEGAVRSGEAAARRLLARSRG